ncbi:30S ribosomal protein S16 [Mycoplasmoides genitalium]
MVKIRLMRMGRVHYPLYRIVAVDSRVKRNGKYIALIGHLNPALKENKCKLDETVALDWLNKGAIPTDTVRSLFSESGLWKKFIESKNKKETNPKK